ncbi:hypothetical protein HH310_00370 [Actinoplanes sp. TBRC 11911]|uniref:hypothetical protein n=1 Tax=Actinoplanes sp. TBRC 11911 TaxID=2729386 RepID=UPI00145C9B4F|nr:hypothetical protein [Actinoplanes sp. TBRC 11911]NMO49659.1 hypothetical protein [Actinoplanes sp. TBRC 11911]
MRRRTQWMVYAATAVLGVGALGVATVAAKRYIQHAVLAEPPTELHVTAASDASKKVDALLQQFAYDHLYKADDYVHTAGQQPGIAVLSVTGQTHWQSGVTLVLKVTGHGTERGADGSLITERDAPICFRLQLGPETDDRDNDITCPPTTPLQITKDPSLDGVDNRLPPALRAAGPHEPAVRAALAALHLDPAIHQDVITQNNRVGVALRATQYDCIIIRITTKDVQLWRPSHTQLSPGELPCSAGLALGPEFKTYPH